MNTIFIHHHLGLGDHIVCNGLVRFLIKREHADCVYLAVKSHNLKNVKRMYRDENKIIFIPITYEWEFYFKPLLWKKIVWDRSKLFRIGFENCRTDWDVSFYDSLNIAFQERWNSFYIERDPSAEQMMCDLLNLPNQFALVHNTSSKQTFDLKLATKLPVVYVKKIPQEQTIFDWYKVIEKAKEIHCIDSSFFHFVDSVALPTTTLFFHKANKNGLIFKAKNNWHPIEY